MHCGARDYFRSQPIWRKIAELQPWSQLPVALRILNMKPTISTATHLLYDQLTTRQQETFNLIVHKIYDLSAEEAKVERESDSSGKKYARFQFHRRPRHVCFIDGSRGAGKTTLMLTIREYLKHLGWQGWDDSISSSLRHDDVKRTLKGSHFKYGLLTPHEVAPANKSKSPRHTAHVLPVLFPSDLENAQPVMEGLFRLLADSIDNRRVDTGSQKRDEPASVRDAAEKEAEKLKKKIYQTVAKGWFQSQREGLDAILAEAHSYDDFLDRRGRASGGSYDRVRHWRDFVNEYLNHFQAQTLIVCIDDTDVSPEVSADILHTIRIFLDHPRIVTLIAGNLRTMRQSLLQRNLKEMHLAVAALASPDGQTALEWRRFMRQQVEEYLDKILPRANRYFNALSNSLYSTDADTDKAGTDFKKVSKAYLQKDDDEFKGVDFDEYCENCLLAGVQEFLRQKLLTHWNWLDKKRELESSDVDDALKYQVSWWLLRHWYGERLQPRTFRELGTLLELTAPTRLLSPSQRDRRIVGERDTSKPAKKLAVVLFGNPLNYELSHRFGDGDSNVVTWLRGQQVSSVWHGGRRFVVNQRKLIEGSYSYDFICFRMDLAIATPLRENPDAEFPPELLPVPAGRNLSGRPPFYGLSHQPLLAGVAKRLEHSLIPANCIYFHDLDCLPDIAFCAPDGTHPWIHSAVYEWSRLFQSRVKNPSDHVQQAVERYVRDVVLPFASIEIGRYVPDPEETGPGMAAELLAAEITPQSRFFAHERSRLDRLRRSVDYMAWVSKSGLVAEGTRQAYEREIGGDLDALLQIAFAKVGRGGQAGDEQDYTITLSPKNFGGNMLDMLRKVIITHSAGPAPPRGDRLSPHWVSYQWLLNDIRRGWHVTRIALNHFSEVIEHQPLEPQKFQGDKGDQRLRTPRRDFSRTDRYTIRSILATDDIWAAILEWPFDKTKRSLATADFPDWGELKTWDELSYFDIMCWIAGQKLGLSQKDTANGNKTLVEEGLKKAAGQGGPALFSLNDDLPYDSRFFRALFLYVYGIAPCLPALIHVDVAGLYYGQKVMKPEPGIDDAWWHGKQTKAIAGWEEFIKSLQRFILRFRLTLELQMIELEIAVKKPATKVVGKEKEPSERESAFEKIKRGVMLDACFSTLGLEGCAGLKKKQMKDLKGEGVDEANKAVVIDVANDKLISRIFGLSESSGTSVESFYPTSIFAEIDRNLASALDYIAKSLKKAPENADMMQKMWEEQSAKETEAAELSRAKT